MGESEKGVSITKIAKTELINVFV